jgi:putative oxidoreductase
MLMDLGILILRLVVGLVFMAHGSQKLFGWFGGPGLGGTAQFFQSLGLRPTHVWAAIAGLAEFVGGALTALGFLGPWDRP